MQLGPFFLEERLDSGGQFAFFRATRKVLVPYRSSPAQCVVLRVSREAADERWPHWIDAAGAKILHHPGIVEMLDDGVIEGYVYFSFEYVDGVDLRALLGDLFPRSAALAVVGALMRALCASHGLASVDGASWPFHHGRISPRWVFVSRLGEVKLGGFGLGHVKPEREPSLRVESFASGVFLAPEQIRGDVGNYAQTDIYQVGLLLHLMLFGTEFRSELLARLVGEISGRPAVATALPPTDPELGDLLRRMLAGRPQDRFDTIIQAREAIEEVTAQGAPARGWLADRVALARQHRRG